MDNNLLDDHLQENLLVLDKEGQKHALIGAKWASFLAILGIIFLTLPIIVLSLRLSIIHDEYSMGFFLIFVIVLVILSIPLIYLLSYSSNMKRAVKQKEPKVLEDALKWSVSFYRFYGILFIIYFVLIIVFFSKLFFLA